MIPKSFIREKKIYCGSFLEVEIYRVYDVTKKGRKEKKQKSSLKMIQANEKNAKKKLRRKIAANFDRGDYVVHLTYAPEFLPDSPEEAEKILTNYIRRINNRRKKEGLPKMKYIAVTEWKEKDGGKIYRLHHHVIMDGALCRDTIEELWTAPRRKGEKVRPSLGYVNVNRLQPSETGFTDLANYLTKGIPNKRRWRASQGLKEPVVKKSDYRWSGKKLNQMAALVDVHTEWEKLYPEYWYSKATTKLDEMRGWMISIVMRKKESDVRNAKNRHTGDIARVERIRPGQSCKRTKRKQDEP